MNSVKSVNVRVDQAFLAPPEQVFDAWLDPALVGRWMFGPALRDEEVLHTRIDARLGGAFSFLVRRQGQDIDHVGTYLMIDRPRRLEFTWGTVQDGASSRVMIEIAPSGNGSQLTLIHEIDAAWADYKDRIQASWAKMLGVLADTLAK